LRQVGGFLRVLWEGVYMCTVIVFIWSINRHYDLNIYAS
jgi:hypothetical protein